MTISPIEKRWMPGAISAGEWQDRKRLPAVPQRLCPQQNILTIVPLRILVLFISQIHNRPIGITQ
jgi:hypothetical protein